MKVSFAPLKPLSITFAQVPEGEVFIFYDDAYLKIRRGYIKFDDSLVAVRLDTGIPCMFAPEDEVQRVCRDVTLTVRD